MHVTLDSAGSKWNVERDVQPQRTFGNPESSNKYLFNPSVAIQRTCPLSPKELVSYLDAPITHPSPHAASILFLFQETRAGGAGVLGSFA